MGTMKNHVNLLPLKHRRAALVRSLLTQWCAVWLTAIVVLAGVIWLNETYYVRILAAVSDHEIACTPVTATATDNQYMRERVHRFDRHETLVGQLGDDKPVLCFLAAVSKSAQLCDGRVVVRDLDFQQQPEGSTPSARGSVPSTLEGASVSAPEAVLTIKGDALDNLAIARFAAALRDSSLFRDVELQSSVGKPAPNRPIHSFVVRCEI